MFVWFYEGVFSGPELRVFVCSRNTHSGNRNSQNLIVLPSVQSAELSRLRSDTLDD